MILTYNFDISGTTRHKKNVHPSKFAGFRQELDAYKIKSKILEGNKQEKWQRK